MEGALTKIQRAKHLLHHRMLLQTGVNSLALQNCWNLKQPTLLFNNDVDSAFAAGRKRTSPHDVLGLRLRFGSGVGLGVER